MATKTFLEVAASLGCVVCRNLGHGATPAAIHHLRLGVGASQRNHDEWVIPLCPPHHQTGGEGVAFHATGRAQWENLYGSERDLHAQTVREVVRELQR